MDNTVILNLIFALCLTGEKMNFVSFLSTEIQPVIDAFVQE